MSSSRDLLRVRVACLALLALIGGLWAPASEHAARLWSAEASALRSAMPFGIGQIPAGFQLSPLTKEADEGAARRFFALVTTDVDADGDVDVIASDGDFDLRIWINDGLGHLSTRPASPGTAWPLSHGLSVPSVSHHTSLAYLQDDGPRPSILADGARTLGGADATSASCPLPIHAPRPVSIRPAAPRAPPLAHPSSSNVTFA